MEQEDILKSDENVLSAGAFATSLLRNNSTIKRDRAASIVENAELIYKRKIEDLEVELKQMKRDQGLMIDLSPTSVGTLSVASDFNPSDFVTKDLALGIKMRNAQIALDIAKERYNFLFGGTK